MKDFCIIDDDIIFTLIATKLLESIPEAGKIHTFANGKVGFEGLKNMIATGERLPDIILVDINMPIWNGWIFLDEFIKIVGTQKPHIYIVSSSNSQDDLDKMRSYPIIKQFITKPITREQLMLLIAHSELS
jgi:CheY-like chemotaxis protein